MSADGLSWVNASGSKLPAATSLPGGARVLCLPVDGGEKEVENLLRRLAAGLSLWTMDENLHQAISGFAYDPICPKILVRAAGEAAARSVLATLGEAPCAVLFADVDHFKSFNDAAGHSHGDEALRLIGEVFRSRIRATDPLWRVGDEFCAVLPNVALPAARRVAEDITRAVSEISLAGRNLSVTMGIAAHTASNLRALLDQADAEMLRGKEVFRGSVYAKVEGSSP